MIRTAIISVTASFVLFGAWTVNLVSYHPVGAAEYGYRLAVIGCFSLHEKN